MLNLSAGYSSQLVVFLTWLLKQIPWGYKEKQKCFQKSVASEQFSGASQFETR